MNTIVHLCSDISKHKQRRKKMRKTLGTIALFLGLMTGTANAEMLPITLLKVTDGDTIKALVNGEEESIRLLNIDCYETSKNPRAIWQSEYYHLSVGQVMQKGEYSKQRLKDLLGKRKDLKLEWSRRDRYKRILGRVYLDDRNINDYMLSFGGCEKYVERKK
jgi:micrococcal nuclease